VIGQSKPSRRAFLGMIGVLGCARGALAAPKGAAPAKGAPVREKLKVVCVGAHADDPDAGCGGTLARYAEAGHAVTALFVTPERAKEAEAACAILGAKAVFAALGGKLELTAASEAEVRRALEAEKADVVFAHWPIDTDGDHQIASALALRAYMALPHRFPLYFYEVQTGAQTLDFVPTAYVDVSQTREKKVRALKTHPAFERIYEQSHEKIEAFRGREIGAFAAEAFRAFGPDAKSGGLPGL
jgi:LmbE family N-acetylglucosaminyl deacetylase